MPIEDCYKKIIYDDAELDPIIVEIQSACASETPDDLQSVMAQLDALNNDCAIRCLNKLDNHEIFLLVQHELRKDDSHLPLIDLMLKRQDAKPGEDVSAMDALRDAFEEKLKMLTSGLGEINSLLWQCNVNQLPYNSPMAAAIENKDKAPENHTFLQLKLLLQCYQAAQQTPSRHEQTITTLSGIIDVITTLLVQCKPITTRAVTVAEIGHAIRFIDQFFLKALSGASTNIPGKTPLRTKFLNMYHDNTAVATPPSPLVTHGLMPPPSCTDAQAAAAAESKHGAAYRP
ncbi:MAG: hypothetical protein P1U40_06250 [Coxiellaceae bacterium]|nr:hypothetical protein [Coxiellaceae bacterium]